MLKGIGERLKKAREAQGLSQRELSKMTGIAQEAICRCETETVLPSSKTITKLARALSLDLNYLLDGEENGTIEFYGDYFDKGSKSRILPLDIPDNSNFFSLRAKKGYPCGIEENDILVLRPINAPTSDETVLVEKFIHPTAYRLATRGKWTFPAVSERVRTAARHFGRQKV